MLVRGELESATAGALSPDELVLIARGVGLHSTSPQPRCLAVRRGMNPSEPRQIFFLLFDLPEFGRFRSEVAALLDTRGGSQPPFDPDALWPILMFAATETRRTAMGDEHRGPREGVHRPRPNPLMMVGQPR